MKLSTVVVHFSVTLENLELDKDQTIPEARRLIISLAERHIYEKEYSAATIFDCPDYPALIERETP